MRRRCAANSTRGYKHLQNIAKPIGVPKSGWRRLRSSRLHSATERRMPRRAAVRCAAGSHGERDRKSVVDGKSVALRVDLGGRRIIKKKSNNKKQKHIKMYKKQT